jgi:hypothetical protein
MATGSSRRRSASVDNQTPQSTSERRSRRIGPSPCSLLDTEGLFQILVRPERQWHGSRSVSGLKNLHDRESESPAQDWQSLFRTSATWARPSRGCTALEYVYEARSPLRHSLPASQSPRAPRSRAAIPDLSLSAGRRERPGAPGCRQGTRAGCDANWESSDPRGRGWWPKQRSQASPRPPAPRALG